MVWFFGREIKNMFSYKLNQLLNICYPLVIERYVSCLMVTLGAIYSTLALYILMNQVHRII